MKSLLAFIILLISTNIYAQMLETPDDVYATMTKAYQELDLELIKKIYRADAQYLSPNREIRQGIEAFSTDFSRMFENARTKNQQLDIQFEIKNRRELNKKMVMDVGIYKVTHTLADGKKERSKGKFTTLLEKDKKVGWQFTLDTYNGLPTPPEIYPVSSRIPEEIIRGNIKQFSKNLVEGNFEAVADAYTKDGKIFPSGSKILSGHEALLKYWTPASDSKSRIIEHKVTPEDITINRDTAIDYGYYEGKSRNGDGEEFSWKGKYVIVWKEVMIGVWKIELDIWNRVNE